MTFTIPGQLPGYNQLKGKHWTESARIKREAMEVVMWSAKAAKVQPVHSQVIVKIQCYEPNKRRDPDNVNFGACKVILDALQQIGILTGDGRKYIHELITPMPEVDRKNPRVEIEITEVKS